MARDDIEAYFPAEFALSKGWRKSVNQRLKSVLKEISGGRFLEIGIGPKIRRNRFKLMHEFSIDYTGLDFQNVCNEREQELRSAGLRGDNIRFLPNRRGSYLYNIVRLHRSGEKFDLVYLDGHHTLYTDFPVAFACLPLLRRNSYIAFDDVRWRLADKEASRRLSNDNFYRSIYDFDLYEEDEKKERHIGLIIREYLLPYFDLQIVHDFSCPAWILLKAGHSWQFSK